MGCYAIGRRYGTQGRPVVKLQQRAVHPHRTGCMKRPIVFITSTVLVLLICCIAAGLFWDGYFLPGKPCRLLTYPDATRTARPFSLVATETIDTVLEFYNEHLSAQPASLADLNEWQVEKLSEGSYLYSCYGTDINLITTETGCIFVSFDDAYTKIVGEFYRSEGSNTPCERN